MALGRQTRGDWPQCLLSWGLVGPGARSGPTSPVTSRTRERKPGVQGTWEAVLLFSLCSLLPWGFAREIFLSSFFFFF